jgi:hypothetical protein
MPANPRKFVARNKIFRAFMSPRRAALRRQALVMAMAFAHHRVQEKTASEAGAEIAPREMCAN